MFYFDILKRFYQDKIKYLIVGGLAVNLHGVPRVTQDIDIIIATDKDNILKINKIMKDLNYVQIPEQIDQSFRSKSSTRSAAIRPLIPEQVVHFLSGTRNS